MRVERNDHSGANATMLERVRLVLPELSDEFFTGDVIDLLTARGLAERDDSSNVSQAIGQLCRSGEIEDTGREALRGMRMRALYRKITVEQAQATLERRTAQREARDLLQALTLAWAAARDPLAERLVLSRIVHGA